MASKQKQWAKQPTKLRVGDEVVVISGAHKGSAGTIARFNADRSRAFVKGVNRVKRHVKPNPMVGESGGVVEKEASVAISNLSYALDGQGTRLGYRTDENGNKVRFSKRTGDQV